MEGFDLFTFIATIINFIVLIVLLRIFLYKRIIKAMDERQRKIQEKWDNAEENQKEAEKNAEEFRKQREEIEKRETELIQEAEERAQEREKKLVDEARKETDERKREWEKSIRREQEQFLDDFRVRTSREIMDLMGKILSDIADTDLQKKTVDKFVRTLQDTEKLKDISGTITVKTSQKLEQEYRKKIEDVLKDRSRDGTLSLEYREDPNLISGIEVSTESQKISWNVRRYMNEAAENISQYFESKKGRQENEYKK
jgi:F-type H+-transporting ATPase subunit b